MNKENLLKMAAHIRTVPQEMFDMDNWRSEGIMKPVCMTMGCAIGHSTVLDAENVEKNFSPMVGGKRQILFKDWSEEYTGLRIDCNKGRWCFSLLWSGTDNTPEGAANRIEWLVNKGLPENWEQQISGKDELCYL